MLDMTAFQNLEQLKWWHIRSVESAQTIEAENWNLRRSIVGEDFCIENFS
jgi:hypothetical protein